MANLVPALISLQPYMNIVDATRQSDGRVVVIKKVYKSTLERELATYLSQPGLREEPWNHSVPILDSFDDEADTKIAYIVMPLLRPMDDPPFNLVHDVLDFVDQVLEVRQRLCEGLTSELTLQTRFSRSCMRMTSHTGELSVQHTRLLQHRQHPSAETVRTPTYSWPRTRCIPTASTLSCPTNYPTPDARPGPTHAQARQHQ